MLADARAVADGSLVEADLCVIGAGPAGITIARELVGTGIDVVVLESGGFDVELDTYLLAAGEVVGEPLLDYAGPVTLANARSRVLGGSSSLWSGYCRPLQPINFEQRPFQEVSGWPIGPDDLARHYERAAEILQLGEHTFDASWWATRIGRAGPVDLGPDVTTAAIQRNAVHFGTFYRADLAAAANVHVLHHANVTDLTPTAGGDHVGHLVVRTLAGTTFQVRAEAYVLAAGGIEVARLLLASRGAHPEGLGNGTGLVGRYYADHNKIAAGFVVSTRPAADLALYDVTSPPVPWPTPQNAANELGVTGVWQLSEDVLRREGLPDAHLECLVDTVDYPPAQAGGIGVRPIVELLRASGTPAQSIVALAVFLESVPCRDSRVLLSPTRTDALGLPVVQLDQRRDARDEQFLHRAMRIFAEAMGDAGFGRLQHASGWVGANPDPPSLPHGHYLPLVRTTPTGNAPAGVDFGTTYHHMCTTRMDTDPTAGVVDADGRLHEVDNVFVAGSAVFPTGAGTHPTMTIVALALRLAAHLREAVLA